MAQTDSAVTVAERPSWLAAVTAPLRQKTGAQSAVLSGSIIMLASMAIVSVLNFAYQIVMARMLGPSQFGHINAAVTILLLSACASLAFQLVCTKFVARNPAPGAKAWVYKSLLSKAWIVSVGLAFALFLMQKPVAHYLNLPNPWILGVLAIGIAAYAPVGVKRGAMQGLCSFPRLGGNFVLEAFMRLATAVIFVALGYGVLGAVGAISAAVVAAYFAPPIPRELRVKPEEGEPASFAEALQAIVFFVGQVIINNIDILLVKHFFAPVPAGFYAAVALIGRFLYFIATQSVVNAMFPVSAADREQRHTVHTVLLPLMLVFGISVAFVALVGLFPHLIIDTVFGAQFHNQIESLLAPYAVATGLYALSVVLIAHEMSRRIANTGWLQLVFSGVLVLAIGVFHGSLQTVVTVRIVLMALMLLMVSIPFLRRQKRPAVLRTA